MRGKELENSKKTRKELEKTADKKILRDGIAGLITGLVMILGYFGVNIPVLTDSRIGQLATVIAFVVAYVANHYFNHNYSAEAKKAQELTDALKAAGELTTETSEDILVKGDIEEV